MYVYEDTKRLLEKSYPVEAAKLLARFYGNSKGRKNQKMGFVMTPEQDKTKPLTYKMEVHLHIADPPRFLTWPITNLGKAMVSYHTEVDTFFEYSEPKTFIDPEENRLTFNDDIDYIRWEDWLLILIEFKEAPVKEIVESLAATYKNIPEEIKTEHIQRMRKAHFFTKRKRDPDVGVNGDDGSIYGEQLMNEDWVLDPTILYDESSDSGSPNGVNGVNGHR